MNRVEATQLRGSDPPREADHVLSDHSLGDAGKRALDGIENLIFRVRTAIETGSERSTDLDPGQSGRDDHGILPDVAVKRLLHGVGLGFL